MIFGIGLASIGYAIFYWGIHHFPGWDCPTKDGCRYSLLELLGIPKSWGTMAGQTTAGRYADVGLTVGQQPIEGDEGTNPSENMTTPNALTGGSNWISGILNGLGAPVSTNNINKLNAWNACEGNLQGHSGLGINNPFNTTLNCCGGVSVPGNSAGVKNYPTMTQGIQATVQTIQGTPAFRFINSNLVNDGTFADFASAVGSSGWGTSGSCIAGAGVSVSTA